MKKGCEGGLADACADYGLALDVVALHNDADAMLARACDGSSAKGCTELARRVRESDPERALQLLTRGCQAGSADGCLRLGLEVMWRRGAGADEAAAKAFRAACDKGERRGCDLVGARQVRPELTLRCLDGDERACREVDRDADRDAPLLRRRVDPPEPYPRLPTPFSFL
ncbi:MAG: hypothetical protein QM765_13560 [Myxococcales bacterium]